tara:strand:- start:981 stop:1319 length:339 start_codon:yes stop_codon:yes gene_type:complete
MKTLAIAIIALLVVACSPASKKESSEDTTAPAKAAENVKKAPQSNTNGGTTCTVDSDTRTIEVKSINSGCEVSYTKQGKTSAVASSTNGTSHCENVKTRMVNNLTSAGFTCK